MKLNRREFVGMAGSSFAIMAVAPASHGTASAETEGAIEKNGWRLTASPTGDILSLRNSDTELVNRKLTDSHPRILIPWKKLFTCNHPTSVRREGSKLLYQYSFSDRYTIRADYEIELLARFAPGEQNQEIFDSVGPKGSELSGSFVVASAENPAVRQVRFLKGIHLK